MRKLLFLLILPSICIAQKKGDNTIIVTGVTFAEVKSAFLDSGYFFDQQNAEDGTLVTKERSGDNAKIFGERLDRYHIIIYVRVKDSVATFHEDFNYKAQGSGRATDRSSWQSVEYWKSKSSVPYHLFEYMDIIAKSFGKPVSYLKR